MYSRLIETGRHFTVQQTVTGAGTFSGVELGRTRHTVTNANPDAVVHLAARQLGTITNANQIEFRDPGSGTTYANTTAQMVGATLVVMLARNTGGITATAAQVAAAIRQAQVAFTAKAGGTGAGVVAAMAPQSVTGGGLDATVPEVPYQGSFFRWDYASGASAGLFYFDHQSPLVLRGFQMKFTIPSGTKTVVLDKVPLDEILSPVTAEAIKITGCDSLTNTNDMFSLSDMRDVLPIGFAYRVTLVGGGIPGMVRMVLRKDAAFPYP